MRIWISQIKIRGVAGVRDHGRFSTGKICCDKFIADVNQGFGSAACVSKFVGTAVARLESKRFTNSRIGCSDAVEEFAIISFDDTFQHGEARRVAAAAERHSFARTIIVDLSRAKDASTAAFADLIVLRRAMLRVGRDLKLSGLRDRAAKVYEVNRLAEILPMR